MCRRSVALLFLVYLGLSLTGCIYPPQRTETLNHVPRVVEEALPGNEIVKIHRTWFGDEITGYLVIYREEDEKKLKKVHVDEKGRVGPVVEHF